MTRAVQLACVALALAGVVAAPLALAGDGRGYPRGGGGIPPIVNVTAVNATSGNFNAIDAGTVKINTELRLGEVTPSSIPSGTGTAYLGSRATTNGALWLGVTSPSVSNYILSSDTSGATVINATSGQSISIAINNSIIGTASATTMAYPLFVGDYGPVAKSTTNTAPTVTACSGGSAASITSSNGSAAFVFDVGTSCAGESTAVITMEAVATGYVCHCSSTTADRMVVQRVMPASTTQVTMQNVVISTGANGDWTDGADLACSCHGI